MGGYTTARGMFERNAPFVDDAEEWLENVRLAARKFFHTLIEQHEPKVREASWAAETLIEKHFRTRYPPMAGHAVLRHAVR